jgi:hypothetical protein
VTYCLTDSRGAFAVDRPDIVTCQQIPYASRQIAASLAVSATAALSRSYLIADGTEAIALGLDISRAHSSRVSCQCLTHYVDRINRTKLCGGGELRKFALEAPGFGPSRLGFALLFRPQGSSLSVEGSARFWAMVGTRLAARIPVHKSQIVLAITVGAAHLHSD